MPAGARERQRGAWLVPVLALLIVVLAALSLGLGPARFGPVSAARALVWDIGPPTMILREIRLPRTLLAIMIGFTLGLSGAALQGLLRNPLADASVFGAPQAAAFGAVLVLYFGLAGALSWALPAAAIGGALLSIVVLVMVAGRDPGTVVLVLAGLAVGSLAGAATSLALSLSPNPFALTEIVFWLLGSLEDRAMTHVYLAAPFLALACGLLLGLGQPLRALALGEETARTLGIAVARTRALVVLAVAIGTGASVAVAGVIGFVGLVAPHLARGVVGHDPARVLWPSGFIGAALLLAADCAARLTPSLVEPKIGVLTALIGVPFFLRIIARSRGALLEETP